MKPLHLRIVLQFHWVAASILQVYKFITKPAALFIDTTLTHNPGRLPQACKNGATTTLQSAIEIGVFTSLGVLKVWGV